MRFKNLTKHNGKYYEKGDKCPKELVELMSEKGLLEGTVAKVKPAKEMSRSSNLPRFENVEVVKG